jgi:hypothetical protein
MHILLKKELRRFLIFIDQLLNSNIEFQQFGSEWHLHDIIALHIILIGRIEHFVARPVYCIIQTQYLVSSVSATDSSC